MVTSEIIWGHLFCYIGRSPIIFYVKEFFHGAREGKVV